MNIKPDHYVSLSRCQCVDQGGPLLPGHKSHPLLVVSAIIARNGNQMTLPLSSVVMQKKCHPQVTAAAAAAAAHNAKRGLKRQAGDPSVPHMAPLSW